MLERANTRAKRELEAKDLNHEGIATAPGALAPSLAESLKPKT